MTTKTPDALTRPRLLALATSLNESRITSNALEATASQRGVYGKIAEALEQTLTLLTGDDSQAAYAYQGLLDGCTVEQALEAAAADRAARSSLYWPTATP